MASVIGEYERALSKFWLCMSLWGNADELKNNLTGEEFDIKQPLSAIRKGVFLSHEMRIINHIFTKRLNGNIVI